MTLYAFSRENWARSDDEVTGLFGLLEAAIRSETAELGAQGVRIRLLGRLDELPDATRRSIDQALDATAGGDRLLLNIAFNYAGRSTKRPSGHRSTPRDCPTRTSSSARAASSACRTS
jgi:undecaprenyl diphosphate synthase